MQKRIIEIMFAVLTILLLQNIVVAKEKNAVLENKQIKELLSKMTIEEKIGQLAQFHPWSRSDSAKLAEAVRQGQVSSFLNIAGRENKTKLQRIAVEESRLGIPLIYARDVIHGYKTIFPIPLGQSASWNAELVQKASAIAAKEAAQMGIHWTFAPMLDIARDPRWGRIAESCGEDPYLASEMAKAMVNGFQGDDLSDPNTIAACAKHFVGYGAAEGGRDYNTTYIPEHLLRNVYLRPFKAAVGANVATIMSAFNDLNGVPTSGNPFTLRQILRNEWKFDGCVVSDWDSMEEMIEHGFCADEKEVALKALKAGVDMEMSSECYAKYVKELIEEKKLSVDLLDASVANILRVKMRLGLFENPYPVKEDKSVILHKEHLAVARELAAQSMVLLKNESQTLPVSKKTKTIALIGPLADSGIDQMGTWVPDGQAEDCITILEAFKKNTQNVEIIYEKGIETCRSKETKLIEKAVNAAKKADIAIMVMGEDYLISGEAHCRAFINLPGIQEELIEAVSETGTPVVLVVMAGRPLTFTNIIPKVQSILYAWHPGTMAGPALADILWGKVVPSGKLTATFPKTVGQIPAYYNHKNTGRPPSKEMMGIPVGSPEDPIDYLSYYLDAGSSPQYPFGFGLSYSSFEYKNLQLSNTKLEPGKQLEITVDLKNTGKFNAIETVQLYTRDISGSITRPVKELKGYKRVSLKPSETQKVNFQLTEKDLAFYNIEMQYTSEPGKFEVMVGSSAADESLLKSSFELVCEK